MDIRLSLIENRSKANIIKIVDYVLADKSHVQKLVSLVFDKDDNVSFRASWATIHLFEKDMKLIYPYLDRFVKHLSSYSITDSVKRNILRSLQFVTLPEELQGQAADICFKFLSSNDEPIATRAFSIKVLENLCTQHPDLISELTLTIEDLLPNASSGLKNRGEHTLKRLRKLSKS